MTNELTYQQPYRKYGAMLLALLMLGACGELSYKRGANAHDLAQTKKHCMAKNSASMEINNCMIENGWTVQNLAETEPLDSELVAESFINPDNRQIITRPPAAASSTPYDQAALQPTQKKIAQPTDIFIISSWWKLGSNADQLKSAIDACTGTLGEAHRPNQKTRAVTRSLLSCMKDRSWRGLREK